jgi:hypothetical protein
MIVIVSKRVTAIVVIVMLQGIWTLKTKCSV